MSNDPKKFFLALGILALLTGCQGGTTDSATEAAPADPPAEAEPTDQADASPPAADAAPAASDYTIEVEQRSPQPTAKISFRLEDATLLGNKIVEIVPKIQAHLAEIGTEMTGPVYTRYNGFGEGYFDAEIGVPVAAAIESKGEVEAGELPGGDIATTWHIGNYTGLPGAHQALANYATERGQGQNGGSWEIYVAGPPREPDPSAWRTQVFVALQGSSGG